MTDVFIEAVTDGPSIQFVLKGEIDMENSGRVDDEICDAISNQMTAVSIDLSDVTYLDSAGLRVLFGLVDRLPTLQIGLVLIAPLSSPARRVIELSGLSTVATVVPAAPPP